MKLLTYNDDGRPRPGVLLGDDILDLTRAADRGGDIPFPDSVRGILADEAGLDRARKLVDAMQQEDAGELRADATLRALADVSLMAPIPAPGLILSVGMNYRQHLEEMNTAIPERPAAFIKTPTSLTGTGHAIRLPEGHADMVDWEGELTFVIGKPCHRVSEADALDHVAGYTIANDVSARDWVAPVFAAEGNMAAIHAWERNVLGKNFPTFTPMGPVIVTADEIEDPHDLHLVTKLNGEVMQDTQTDLLFQIPKLIAYYSQWFSFAPGDVVTTGSPSGVGFGRDPKVFMKAGDTIEISISGIGTLANPVEAA